MLKEYLIFRKMITVNVIQGIFGYAVFAWLLGLLYINDSLRLHMGLVALVIVFVSGAAIIRIICEFIVVIFMINDNLNEIRKNTQTRQDDLAGE